jgi:hypothetical protein
LKKSRSHSSFMIFLWLLVCFYMFFPDFSRWLLDIIGK